jgi:hypothetical protein
MHEKSHFGMDKDGIVMKKCDMKKRIGQNPVLTPHCIETNGLMDPRKSCFRHSHD